MSFLLCVPSSSKPFKISFFKGIWAALWCDQNHVEVFFKKYIISEKYIFLFRSMYESILPFTCTLVSADSCEWSKWNTYLKLRRCLIDTSGLKFKAQFCMYAFYSSPHIWKSHLKFKHFSPSAHVHWPGHWSSAAHVGAAPIAASAFCILCPPHPTSGTLRVECFCSREKSSSPSLSCCSAPAEDASCGWMTPS